MYSANNIAVKKNPRPSFWNIEDEVTLLLGSSSLLSLVDTVQETLHLGAINKRLSPTEEINIGQKILWLTSGISNPPLLTQKEYGALPTALATILSNPYIAKVRLPKHNPSIEADTFHVIYALKFLCLAEPAIQYGAANCDGQAAVTLYYLLRDDVAARLKNICICSVDARHTFIAVNRDESGNAIVIDSYYGFVLPLFEAIGYWKTKGYNKGEIKTQSVLKDISAFLKFSEAQEIFKKLEAAENSRQKCKEDLNRVLKQFKVEPAMEGSQTQELVTRTKKM